MEISLVQQIKLGIVDGLGLSRDALHIHAGLMAFFLTALVFRKPLGSILPCLGATLVALAIELLDARDDFRAFGYWRWEASLHDIINTVIWPVAIVFFSRFTRLFGSSKG